MIVLALRTCRWIEHILPRSQKHNHHYSLSSVFHHTHRLDVFSHSSSSSSFPEPLVQETESLVFLRLKSCQTHSSHDSNLQPGGFGALLLRPDALPEAKTNEYINCNRSLSLPDVRSSYCQLSSVACFEKFGHVCRHDILSKIVLQGRVASIRCRGRTRKSCENNIKECTGQSMLSLPRIADDRNRWVAITTQASQEFS